MSSPSATRTHSRRQWSRLAHVVFQLCLVWQPATCNGRATAPRKRRLRQRTQQHYNHDEPPSSRAVPHPSSSSLTDTASASSPSTTSRQLGLSSRIVNGHDAPFSTHDFPFFVQWFRGCGATLIHADVVLTAAHCYSDTLEDHRVRVEGDPSYALIEIVDHVVHPNFNDATNLINNNANDFMLLKLQKPLPFIRPVQLHSDQELPLMDQEDLTIVGYGLTAEDGDVATVLQEATVQYHQDCSFARYRPGKVGHETMFCAHGKFNDTQAIDSCQGDSGGPILRKTPQGFLQVGVTSWGEGCARPDAPGIYARTKVAHEWIQQQLCHLSSVPPPQCSFPNNMTLTSAAMTSQSNSESQDEDEANESPASNTNVTTATATTANQTDTNNNNNMTTVETSFTLRVDLHYDNYPQEISWALAERPSSVSAMRRDDAPRLKFVSPRQPVSMRNQRVSQHILNVQPGMYRLEVYDTIAGDGLSFSSKLEQEHAIQVWLLTTTTTTTRTTAAASSGSQHKNGQQQEQEEHVVSLDDEDDVSVTVTHHVDDAQLLWSHSGDFGEFVSADVQVTAE